MKFPSLPDAPMKPKKVTIAVRVPPATHQKLKRIAGEKRISQSAVIQVLVDAVTV